MDPITLGLGAEPAQRRLSQYLVLTLASVLAPGVVSVVAAGALIVRARHGGDSWQQIVATSEEVRGSLAVLLGVALFAAAYAVGYVARELAFKILGLLERIVPRSLPSAAELHGQLRETYGEQAVRDCLLTHPLLGRFLRAEREPPPVPWHGQGGALRVDNGLEAFLYAKSWLGQAMPNLAPNDMETEINILLSMLCPVGLGGAMYLAYGQPGPAVAALTVALAAGLWWLLLASAMRLRRGERWEALRGLLEGHEMALAAARQRDLSPAVPTPLPAPRPDGDAQPT